MDSLQATTLSDKLTSLVTIKQSEKGINILRGQPLDSKQNEPKNNIFPCFYWVVQKMLFGMKLCESQLPFLDNWHLHGVCNAGKWNIYIKLVSG